MMGMQKFKFLKKFLLKSPKEIYRNFLVEVDQMKLNTLLQPHISSDLTDIFIIRRK